MVTVHPRSDWAARAPRNRTPFTPSDVLGACMHYNGPAVPIAAQRDPRAFLRSVQNFHMDSRGWADIAYNLAVDADGELWECRGLRYESAANGNEEVNDHWVAIFFILGDRQTPSTRMLTGGRAAVSLVRQRYPRATRIIGHRDLRATSCPGDPLYRHVRAGTFNPSSRPPSEDDVSAADVFNTRYKEYVDEKGDGVRNLRKFSDIVWSTHAASVLGLRQSRATAGAIAALARLVAEQNQNLTEATVRQIVQEEIKAAIGDLAVVANSVEIVVPGAEEPSLPPSEHEQPRS